ncbi:MAG: hypothetical protein AVDCRST_MAG02-2583 [uncultured Rubrobacteraceae bacterium]|uniref:Uncharacterized protein n=1 Tax=uncultured Rubrobacteraceae bacterium TaxID=349277 RepID=A0A6J4R532_9ACTN|nr:MAG: hypothetical protein AVDCRST_MAG02-2583 [uncultured Rubrobacteraceae bacterium]
MARGAATIAHWREPRCLGIAEVKRLCSLPDDFELTGRFADQWARLGNAVPPLLIKAVAEHVRDTIVVLPGRAEDPEAA